MNGPSHDWGILRGADGVRYRVVGPRGGPYTSRPQMLPPWQLLARPQWRCPHASPPPPRPILLPPTAPADEAMPTLTAVKADDDVVEQAQAMKINLETNEALSVARNSVSIINGVSAMLKMTQQMVAQHLIKIYNTNQGLLAHVHHHDAMDSLLPSSWRLHMMVGQGLHAQLDHLGAMQVQIKVLQRLADTDDADVVGPWVDEAGSNDDASEAGPAAAPGSS